MPLFFFFIHWRICTHIHAYTYTGIHTHTRTQVAGVQSSFPYTEDLDPAIIAFEHACARHGLAAVRVRGGISKALRERVGAGQTLWQRLVWVVCGYWDGMMLYKIKRKGDV